MKLKGSNHGTSEEIKPFPFDFLPEDVNNDIWKRIEAQYGLEMYEVIALQNEIKKSGIYICNISYDFYSILYYSNNDI